LKVAGAVSVSLLLAFAGFTLGRMTSPDPVEPDARLPAEAPPRASPAPILQGPLGRTDLISAAAATADSFAFGIPPRGFLQGLAGRRFKIRIPFGCGGSSRDSDEPLRWDYDPDRQRLRLRVAAEDLSAVDWVQPLIGDSQAESIDVFWLSRPWTSSEECPASTSTGLGAAATGNTLGLAQVSLPTNSRVGRLKEPFTAQTRLSADGFVPEKGLHLLLEGRIANWPIGRPIACVGPDPKQRPVCLIGAELERVAVENPIDRSVLADWQL